MKGLRLALLFLCGCPAVEEGSPCVAGKSPCGNRCFDLQNDRSHCGSCDAGCAATETCALGACSTCAGAVCGNSCADLSTDLAHCGRCDAGCAGGACSGGTCRCPVGQLPCASGCVDTSSSVKNCGGCGFACAAGFACEASACLPSCQAPQQRCDGGCADFQTSWANCGSCAHGCGGDERCQAGSCVPCSGDCDRDGWAADAGDCCDQWGGCAEPALVNPGARELVGNGIDDNCNGLVDAADLLDVAPCDADAGSRVTTAMDLARTLGLCRTTLETERTWGVISATLLRADGLPGAAFDSASIRPVFGGLGPLEGSALGVLSSGVASDSVQGDPGPSLLGSDDMATVATLASCGGACIKDWLDASRAPLKQAGKLPEAPGCGGQLSDPAVANDSVMLHLRIRAPTNASSVSVKTRFFSVEYPEYVCSAFNDQVVLLIDTPGGPATPRNPPDKNLMTYSSMGKDWPVGINLAAGTGLFQACTTQAVAPACWDKDVSSASCKLGAGDLLMTPFGLLGGMGCLNGGGTSWLLTQGSVRPGEVFELRAVVWDVGDHILDSVLLIDDLEFSLDGGAPGTTER